MISTSSFAGKNTCCICETGEPYDDIEADFFKLGCTGWLAKNGCGLYKSQSPIVDGYNSTLKQPSMEELCREVDKSEEKKEQLGAKFFQIPKKCEKLKVGYVGHWGSSKQLINYMRNTLGKFLEHTNIPIEIDHTGCSGMSNPEALHSYVRSLTLKKDQYIKVKASQTVSIGAFEYIFPGLQNLYAISDSRKASIQFPKCSAFERDKCVGFEQQGLGGSCIGKDNEQKTITCCRVLSPKKPFLLGPVLVPNPKTSSTIWLTGKTSSDCPQLY